MDTPIQFPVWVIIKMEKDNNYISKIPKGRLNSTCLLLHTNLQQTLEGKALWLAYILCGVSFQLTDSSSFCHTFKCMC